jgi:hypothetical protein
MDIATWIIVAVLSWAAYAGYSNLKTSKKFVDDLYSQPKENIPSTYLLAIRNMTENYPYLKDYTKEAGGIVVFQHRARFMSIGGSIGQILCVVIGIVSLINVYPIKSIWSVIFFFIFGHIGSRFNKKAVMKEMSKVFAIKLENSKNLETRSKYFSIFEQYHETLDAESAKYQRG